MSLKTWKDEFYPELAEAAAKRGWLAAVEHSIAKWSGLYSSVLKRHKVDQARELIYDEGDDFAVDSASCALCIRDDDVKGTGSDCYNCPLYRVRGEACWVRKCGEANSPYGAFVYNGNPRPMIRDLKLALKLVQKEEK